MITKWTIILLALLGAWFVIPVWFPNILHVAFDLGDFQFKYRHILCVIIFCGGWKLKAS